MKKIILILASIIILSFNSCRHNSEEDWTITIDNRTSETAYFVFIKKDGNSKSQMATASNPGKISEITLSKGTIVNSVEFYTGIQNNKMPMVMSYDFDISSKTTLVLKDTNFVYKE